MNLTKNFSDHEMACKCGCLLCIPSAKLMLTLQAIRDNACMAVDIVSGTRCAKHNATVSKLPGAGELKAGLPGDSTASAHTRGEAADIHLSMLGQESAYQLIQKWHKEGKLPWLRYCYMIARSQHVHVGVDDYKRRSSIWGGTQ